MWTLALKVQHQQVFTANKEVKCFKDAESAEMSALNCTQTQHTSDPTNTWTHIPSTLHI